MVQDPENPEHVTIHLLEQYVDSDAIRAAIAHPFASYNPNMMSVRAAIKAVADAAATMHVSRLVKAFNNRAEKLFRTTLEHMNKKNTEEFVALFRPMSVRGGGFLILQPETSADVRTYVEGCTFPVQVEGTGKRIKLMVAEDNGQGKLQTYGVVPRHDAGAVRRVQRQHAENVGVLEDGIQSEHSMVAERDIFPAVPAMLQSYKIIGGAVDVYGGLKYQQFVSRLITRSRGVTLPPVAVGAAGGEFPTLLTIVNIRSIKESYADPATGPFLDHEGFVSQVRELCRLAQANYVATVRAQLARLTAAGAALTPTETWYMHMLEWILEDPKNYVIATMPYTIAENTPSFGGPAVTLSNMAISYRYWMHLDVNGIAFPNPYLGGAAPAAAPPLPVTRGAVFQQKMYPILVTVGDLFDALETREYAAASAEPSAVAGLKDGVADPIAIGEAYRPAILKRDNEVRFKLSILPNKGFNPAFFGGSKSMANLNVLPEDERREFDEGMRNWEFNLHVRNVAGYIAEWNATMRTVVQVLVAHAKRPDRSQLPIIDTFDLESAVPVGKGFVYVPLTPKTVRSDPVYAAHFRIDVNPKSEGEYVASYPNWVVGGLREHTVSAASLFWYHNAVATATEPFSVRSQGTNLDDVAAMIASASPFSAMDRRDTELARSLLTEIMADPATMAEMAPFSDTTALHLIQVTKSAVAPGNSNFAQPFPMLTVEFKSAGVVEAADVRGQKTYKLEYTLGCEATILVESMFIVTALLKILRMNRPEMVLEPVPPSDVPMMHTVAGPFPGSETDAKFKQSVVMGAKQAPLGLTTAFYTSSVHDGIANLTPYAKFIGMDRGDSLMNKAGRYMFGIPGSVPDPEVPTTSGTGFFKSRYGLNEANRIHANIQLGSAGIGVPAFRYAMRVLIPDDHQQLAMSEALLGGRKRYDDFLFCRIMFKHSTAQGRYVYRATGDPWVLNTPGPAAAGGGAGGGAGGAAGGAGGAGGAGVPPPAAAVVPGGGFRDYIASAGGYLREGVAGLAIAAGTAGVIMYTMNDPSDPVRAAAAATVAAAGYAVGPAAAPAPPPVPAPPIPGPAPIPALPALGTPTAFFENNLSLPVYYNKGTGRMAYELVAYVHLGGRVSFYKAIHNRDPSRHEIRCDVRQAWISGVYALVPNILRRDVTTGHVRFTKDVEVGLLLSSGYTDMRVREAEGGRYYLDFDDDLIGADRMVYKDLFVPLFIISRYRIVINVSQADWDISKKAFDRYKSHPRAAKFKRGTIGVPKKEIATMLREGCQGYHYSNSMSLSATVFAVALNGTRERITNWYQENDGTFNEPKAVNIAHPRRRDRHDAALVTLIQREEMRGVGSGATSSTSGTVLITPLVVTVRGPDPEAMATPCYVDNVYVKTANFRVYETRLLTMMYERLSQIRKVEAVASRVQGCLADFMTRTHGIRTIRTLIDYRPAVTPMMASLLLELKDYAKIPQDTSRARSNIAVQVAYKSLMDNIFKVLFRI